MFWITLIDQRYTLTLEDSATFEVRRSQAWAGHVLGPVNFVGIVEAALFTNVGLLRKGGRYAVSWHVHLVLWGLSGAEMKRLCRLLNRRYSTLLPGVRAAHAAPITLAQLTEKACYALKAPYTAYRVAPRRHEHIDRDTGEVTREASGGFNQWKGALGPGDMVRLCRVFTSRTLDQLAFAAGDGKGVLKHVNWVALAPYRTRQSRLRGRARG